MTTLATILVDIDAVAADHPALEQAVRRATRCGARVKIVDVLPRVPAGVRHFVTPDLEEELIDNRRDRLTAIADSVRGVSVTTELLRRRAGIALIHEVLRSGHDLLVRSHGRDFAEGSKPFGAMNRPGFLGGHIPREDGAHGSTQQSIPPSYESVRSGWSSRMRMSTRHSGRRFNRSRRSWTAPRRCSGAGCARPNATLGSARA